MIHAKSYYEDVKGKYCKCGKWRSRSHILYRLRGRVEGFDKDEERWYRVRCKCGETLFECRFEQKYEEWFARENEKKFRIRHGFDL